MWAFQRLTLLWKPPYHFTLPLFYESPLGKSDHCILYFDFLCYCEIESREKTKKYYEKADYQMINEEINKIDWAAEFNEYKNINSMWSAFQTKIRSIEGAIIY